MGYGTLTWYTLKRSNLTGSNIPLDKFIITGRYSGNMIRGKLDGPVMGSNATGKTLHAAFVDGRRVSDWQEESISTTEKNKPSAPETTEPGGERVVTAETSSAREKKSAKANVTEPASEMIGSPEQVRPPATPPSDHSHALNIPDVQANPEAPAEGPSDEAAPENVRKKLADDSSKPAVPAAPKTSLPSPAEKTSESAKPAMSAAPKVVTKRPLPSSATTSNPASAKSSPVDQSLRSLIAPPASLRNQPVASSPPPASTPVAKVPTPPPGPQLTAAEATTLADTEARTWGYDLGEYQLPTSEYNAVGGRWYVVYEAKDVDGKSIAGKHFSVTIDDKTKKAEVTR